MKNTERFSDRVENYVRYRPHYPPAIIACLASHAGLAPGMIVADIGAGTGISSLPFLENGNIVLAVEPNKEMREMAKKLLQDHPAFHAVAGTAEHTTLPDDSVDMIVAGQAFHWFNQEEAKKEFRCIARPGASVVLVWNERLTTGVFEGEYEKLIGRYAIDYKETGHRNIGPAQLAAFFSPAPYEEFVFENAQRFDLEGLKGRLLSSSYTPTANHPSYGEMIAHLEDIFGKYQGEGKVKFNYITRMYVSKLAN